MNNNLLAVLVKKCTSVNDLVFFMTAMTDWLSEKCYLCRPSLIGIIPADVLIEWRGLIDSVLNVTSH